MNEEKRKENYLILQKMFPNKFFINKGEMLKVINCSYSTSKRRDDTNDKYDIPEPSMKKTYKRKGAPYNIYKYDFYDLSVFNTDQSFYWEMIEQRKKGEN